MRVTAPINFTFSDDSAFLKKILAGDINSLNLLVTLETQGKSLQKWACTFPICLVTDEKLFVL